MANLEFALGSGRKRAADQYEIAVNSRTMRQFLF